MRAGRSLPRELQHLDTKGRQQHGWGRIRHPRPVGRILHRFKVCPHGGQGALVLMSASVHQGHMADADPENESVRPGFSQRSGPVHHRCRVADPDVGDSGGDRHAAG